MNSCLVQKMGGNVGKNLVDWGEIRKFANRKIAITEQKR